MLLAFLLADPGTERMLVKVDGAGRRGLPYTCLNPECFKEFSQKYFGGDPKVFVRSRPKTGESGRTRSKIRQNINFDEFRHVLF